MLLRLLEGMSLFHFAKSEAYRPLNFPAHRAPLPCTALRTRCPSGKPAKATPGGKSKAVKPKAVPSGAPSKRARTKQPQDWHFSLQVRGAIKSVFVTNLIQEWNIFSDQDKRWETFWNKIQVWHGIVAFNSRVVCQLLRHVKPRAWWL